ncbi:NAD(P)-dependent oxidoreductase [Methylophilus sp. OH31]|uniref:NAD-dependent epimerase/dehydratase family protein n=1 Tax=Methylophilus sp. OH31 TaxID=1387312 RepID=UPI000464E4D1|nr:NAD(P)-dependent oxidoreductase [Methylophilus sp. OH31]
MKVLILGATGHVGSRLVTHLNRQGYETIAASRGRLNTNIPGRITLDSLNLEALTHYLKGVDAVVNCVAGDKHSIGKGADILVQAAIVAGKPKIIHLSTMSVYGGHEGNITESHAFDPTYGWYAAAKCEAETYMQKYAAAGGQVISFRPGCVHGPGSHLWVSRPANLLRTYRLGDLGDAGDGWSNLVHVDDVVRAIHVGLKISKKAGEALFYNLAAPDSPRWNQYLFDLANGIDATPIKRISRLQLKLDSKILSPAIKIAQILCRKARRDASWLPEPLPPSLSRLFEQHIFLNAEKFSNEYDFTYMSYSQSLQESISWYNDIKY